MNSLHTLKIRNIIMKKDLNMNIKNTKILKDTKLCTEKKFKKKLYLF